MARKRKSRKPAPKPQRHQPSAASAGSFRPSLKGSLALAILAALVLVVLGGLESVKELIR